MHHAAAGPEGEFPPRRAGHPAAQILIRSEQDRPLRWQLVHQVNGIAAGADQIALGFHRR